MSDQSTGGIYCAASVPSFPLDYNDVFNNTNGDYFNCFVCANSLSVAPSFAAPGDYRLGANSLCRNAGDPHAWFNDLDGTRSDMGAYGGQYGVACLPPVRAARPCHVYKPSIQAAYDMAEDLETIKTRDVSFVGDLTFNRDISVSLKGGYDCEYRTNTARTLIVGTFTISAGTVTVENLTFK
jgi:hypothetical protein